MKAKKLAIIISSIALATALITVSIWGVFSYRVAEDETAGVQTPSTSAEGTANASAETETENPFVANRTSTSATTGTGTEAKPGSVKSVPVAAGSQSKNASTSTENIAADESQTKDIDISNAYAPTADEIKKAVTATMSESKSFEEALQVALDEVFKNGPKIKIIGNTPAEEVAIQETEATVSVEHQTENENYDEQKQAVTADEQNAEIRNEITSETARIQHSTAYEHNDEQAQSIQFNEQNARNGNKIVSDSPTPDRPIEISISAAACCDNSVPSNLIESKSPSEEADLDKAIMNTTIKIIRNTSVAQLSIEETKATITGKHKTENDNNDERTQSIQIYEQNNENGNQIGPDSPTFAVLIESFPAAAATLSDEPFTATSIEFNASSEGPLKVVLNETLMNGESNVISPTPNDEVASEETEATSIDENTSENESDDGQNQAISTDEEDSGSQNQIDPKSAGVAKYMEFAENLARTRDPKTSREKQALAGALRLLANLNNSPPNGSP